MAILTRHAEFLQFRKPGMYVFNGAALLDDVILLHFLALHLVVNVPGHSDSVDVASRGRERERERERESTIKEQYAGGGAGEGANFGSGASDSSSISVTAPLVSDTPVWGWDQHQTYGIGSRHHFGSYGVQVLTIYHHDVMGSKRRQ